MSFSDWLESQGYGRNWVVASSLTPRLAAKGHDRAITRPQFAKLKRDYEQTTGDAARRLAAYYLETYNASLLDALLRGQMG